MPDDLSKRGKPDRDKRSKQPWEQDYKRKNPVPRKK